MNNLFPFTSSAMKETVLDEETRLKKLVKDYFGDFVTARKTIEELESTLSDPSYFNERGGLILEEVINVHNSSFCSRWMKVFAWQRI